MYKYPIITHIKSSLLKLYQMFLTLHLNRIRIWHHFLNQTNNHQHSTYFKTIDKQISE